MTFPLKLYYLRKSKFLNIYLARLELAEEDRRLCQYVPGDDRQIGFHPSLSQCFRFFNMASILRCIFRSLHPLVLGSSFQDNKSLLCPKSLWSAVPFFSSFPSRRYILFDWFLITGAAVCSKPTNKTFQHYCLSTSIKGGRCHGTD